jgi:hypothetical protein
MAVFFGTLVNGKLLMKDHLFVILDETEISIHAQNNCCRSKAACKEE